VEGRQPLTSDLSSTRDMSNAPPFVRSCCRLLWFPKPLIPVRFGVAYHANRLSNTEVATQRPSASEA